MGKLINSNLKNKLMFNKKEKKQSSESFLILGLDDIERLAAVRKAYPTFDGERIPLEFVVSFIVSNWIRTHMEMDLEALINWLDENSVSTDFEERAARYDKWEEEFDEQR